MVLTLYMLLIFIFVGFITLIFWLFWSIIKKCIAILPPCCKCNCYNCYKKNKINPEPDNNFDIIIINNTNGNGDQ